jgi:hypothetical protein
VHTLHTNFSLFAGPGYDANGTNARACDKGYFWDGVALPAQIRCYLNLRTYLFFQQHLPFTHAKEDTENSFLQNKYST